MLAEIVSGKIDAADFIFLVALILAVVLTVYAAMQRAIATVLTGAVLAALSLGWWLL